MTDRTLIYYDHELASAVFKALKDRFTWPLMKVDAWPRGEEMGYVVRLHFENSVFPYYPKKRTRAADEIVRTIRHQNRNLSTPKSKVPSLKKL